MQTLALACSCHAWIDHGTATLHAGPEGIPTCVQQFALASSHLAVNSGVWPGKKYSCSVDMELRSVHCKVLHDRWNLMSCKAWLQIHSPVLLCMRYRVTLHVWKQGCAVPIPGALTHNARSVTCLSHAQRQHKPCLILGLSLQSSS